MNVIGIVGPFGSGCTTVAELIQEERGYEIISLSHILKEIIANNEGDIPSDTPRDYLQEQGNIIRESLGNYHLAQEASKIIQQDPSKNYIIDSIRNPGEILYLKNQFPNFYLFGVFADADNRWNRVKNKYNDDRRTFNKDDEKDSGKKEDKNGQKVTGSFAMSDVVILNNLKISGKNQNYYNLLASLRDKLDIIEGKMPFRPNQTETNMALAYAVSMRSSCLKRKVGAVIVDAHGAVFSSGYNEVPSTQASCLNEYGQCYRDQMKLEFKEDIETIVVNPEEQKSVLTRFKDFKILDYCRALHAEENAILNVARVGASSALPTSTLYTSTYPCNLCANKIAQVGIKSVVYFEPYPMEEAKKILTEKRVEQIPFEGVTYNGYFRLMEVVE